MANNTRSQGQPSGQNTNQPGQPPDFTAFFNDPSIRTLIAGIAHASNTTNRTIPFTIPTIDINMKYRFEDPKRPLPRTFLSTMEDYFPAGLPDPDKLRAVSAFLHSGGSQDWWSSIRDTISTWAEFRTAFISKMTDTVRRDTLRQEYENLKQGTDSLDTYYQRLNTLSVELGKSPTAQAEKFHLGLKPHLANEVQVYLNRLRGELSIQATDDTWMDFYPPVADLFRHAQIFAAAEKTRHAPITAVTHEGNTEVLDRLDQLIAAIGRTNNTRGNTRSNVPSVRLVTWADVKAGRSAFLPRFDDLPEAHRRYIDSQRLCHCCRMEHPADAGGRCPHREEMSAFFAQRRAARTANEVQNFQSGPSA